MKVSFGGIGEEIVTFYNKSTGGAESGEPVKMSGNGEVCACASGDRFLGLALCADADFASVQTGGVVTCEYSGSTAPTVGWGRLVADGAGKVKPDSGSTGTEYLILEVDTTGKTVTFVM